MKIILAKNAGFCMGVRRAVEATIDTVHREGHGIATYGPLIHNPQVLGLLADRGVKVLENIPEHGEGTVIIRAHGVPPQEKQALKASGVRVQDATCPRVVKVQAIIKKYQGCGYTTVIIGDRNHAEVIGLMGYAGPDVRVVSNEEDIEGLNLESPYIIVSQTTQEKASFQGLSAKIQSKFPGGEVFNTICDSTRKRQEEVTELCTKVEALVVVGGKNSANTKRLAEIAEKMGRTVFLVETEEDIDWQRLSRFNRVGVTAGASTPTWMINRVLRALEFFPGRGGLGVGSFLIRVIWYLLASNLYVALGGGLLSYSCGLLLDLDPGFPQFFMAFGYLFAMHNLNRFSNQEASKFNDPARLRFYNQFRGLLLGFTVLALAGSLFLALQLGTGPFFLLAVMSMLGVLYSVRLIPLAVAKLIRVRRLKEIPGSKTFFVALAWAFVTVLLPLWGAGRFNIAALGILGVVLGLVFVRNALFDVFDVQGDRIVGKETLPVCIGERKTMRVLHFLLAAVALLLIILPTSGMVSSWAWLALPAVAYLYLLLRLYQRGTVRHGIKLEFGLESVFVVFSVLLIVGRMIMG